MKYDVAVIGSGPGGYIAAIRCAQLGMKTAIVEKYDVLGGTCLNVGCIPAKALLDSTEHYHMAKSNFQQHGINLKELAVNFKQMVKRKSEVVEQVTKGVAFLMKKNKIDVYSGVGSFKDANHISIAGSDKKTSEIETANTIIATGSKPSSLPFIKIDKKRVITSTEALKLSRIPKTMVIIGGGIIGCEMGSVYARLGTKVTMIEYMDRLIPGMDKDMGKEMRKIMTNLGVEVLLSSEVKEVSTTSRSVSVKSTGKSGKSVETKAEYCLVAVGRKPYTDMLGLDKIGIKTDEQGRVPINEKLQTPVKGVYAIGDVVKGAMLAHKAEEEGILAAEIIKGQKPHLNYLLIPSVVYTWPEVAGVGYTEEQLKENKISYKTGKFYFLASGRAVASMDTQGLIKVLADEKTDEILGVHMAGPRVADIIAEAVVAMEYRASAEDIGRMSHAHPTYSEAFKEACLAASDNRALNS